MVEYVDGCVMAQLGTPDMKAPIAYALTYPERIPTGVKPLDLTSLSGLSFFNPDHQRFPASEARLPGVSKAVRACRPF